ncbi:MAG TPA: NAD-dependent epimerase/dehydratase family protein, partial [Anaerolineales bacterium]|nr:NAD-dependent epimerase/dehydratase family protein [Anaerolineales bacterium]
KIAVLGTDCALGKRTTTRFLMQAMRKAGYRAEMIYTGQTGWMQGAKYGFIFDSTLNDFISGEMEHAIVQCWDEAKPHIIFIEGQSSLRNPSGPAGAEWIISANADAAVLQHNPPRKRYKGLEDFPADIPTPKEEIDLIRILGAPTVALTINTYKMKEEDARQYAAQATKELGIPAILPLEDGVEALVPIFKQMIDESIAQV